MAAEARYQVSMQLSVLEHLGENLYSGTPAVLTEVVANAWDANATEVRIDTNSRDGTITITDNGHGMDLNAVNDRFLSVGFRRRLEQSSVTDDLERPVMGRKGIGKLSLFAIADEFTVHSKVRSGNVEALLINRNDLVNAIKSKTQSYNPQEIKRDWPSKRFPGGTQIKITKFKGGRGLREDFIRQRIARRFSVIGEKWKFRVYVNNKEITVADRGYFGKLQFAWTYGSEANELIKGKASNIKHYSEVKNSDLVGWIGTVWQPSQLKIEGTSETAGGIVVMVRGRVADENIIQTLGDARLFTQYVVGEIHADYLDDENTEDNVITSSRQKLNSDLPVVRQLIEKIRVQLNEIALKWDDLREKEGLEDAVKDLPVIEEWLQTKSQDRQKAARSLIGKVNKIPVKNDQERAELYSYSILAFEKLAVKDAVSELDGVDDKDLFGFLNAFRKIDDVEAALYHELVRGRLEVISRFNNKVELLAKEKELQQELFDNLWLFDPSWDRVTGHSAMEITASKFLEEKGTASTKKDRLDIVYRNPTGQHVIIELKRPGVTTPLTELEAQVEKYKTQLGSLLAEKFKQSDPIIKTYLLVDEAPEQWSNPVRRNEDLRVHAVRGITLLTYKELISKSEVLYREFLESDLKSAKLASVLEKISEALEAKST
ncbi:MAG: ATP-binding protein [Pseudomonadota bacterium]